MTYVMSDLHGKYEKFLQMLDTIHFSDDDDLYILGDVVDRGPQSVELLRYEHEDECLPYPRQPRHDSSPSLEKALCRNY